jgi:predicted transcriptional regulator YdeE
MMPKLVTREAMCIAGVSGKGDETGKAWAAFVKLDQNKPLPNKLSEDGYEIRLQSDEQGPGEVHVGLRVKADGVPSEYQVLIIPGSLYAEFEIYPAKGWESSNKAIDRWLADNAGMYKEALLNGQHFAIEVYDQRYKGDKDPESVVGMLIPVVKVGT